MPINVALRATYRMNFAIQTSSFSNFKSHRFQSCLCGRGLGIHVIDFTLIIFVKAFLYILTAAAVSFVASNVNKAFAEIVRFFLSF